MNYHLTTFGCQMNDHDSERIRGVLEENGWRPVDNPDEADLLVFNTCSVRDSADSRLLGRLGEARRLKKEQPRRLIALGGCFAQSRQEALFTELPFLDVAFGPRNIGELPKLLTAAASGPGPSYSFDDCPQPSADLPSRRLSRHHAWVQVMTGCTNFCSYCVVPQTRGPERSRPAVAICEEITALAADGVVEVTLLGQNVNAYGLDLDVNGGERVDFAALLKRIDGIEGLKRVRFTTSHPKDLSRPLIEAMRDLPTVCEHLHLPVQSGSSHILERMKRGYTRERYLELVEELYREMPGLALTTDIIVGFPGEREEDFHRTLTLVEQCRFDGAFTFVYSPRQDTEAAGLPGRVPAGTVKRRMEELVALVQKTARQKNSLFVGDTVAVLVEGPSRQGTGQLKGRTRGNRIVNFTTPTGAGLPEAGQIVDVAIEAATSTTLKGHLVSSITVK